MGRAFEAAETIGRADTLACQVSIQKGPIIAVNKKAIRASVAGVDLKPCAYFTSDDVRLPDKAFSLCTEHEFSIMAAVLEML